ncbi:putative F420-dependent oxidoreductase family protein [Mycobacterium xenopi 4042]|uniref:Putative F420-dependent oxidoreductase family protein n=1 Tax=Mycobacterium xenopi 4042 TaxID=1299334 RepID=X7YJG1_MYCXE|nr:putative F420-dependent oxidoreductase family protein [Mycobacterium xenopi 4042]
MRVGTTLSYSGGFKEAAEHVVELEKVGVDMALVAEAYSYDAVSQLGYLAAKTSTITLGTGILPIYTRTPTLLAMTAAGLDYVSDGRFHLGLGTSGPQVIEGFHGVEFDAPLGRTREVVDICRRVWRRERLDYAGKYYQVPLPANRGTGLGKSLHLINHPVRERIPISIAALGPKNVELTAEIAEGWQPVFFYPEKAESVWGAALKAGFAKRDPQLGRSTSWWVRHLPSATTSTSGWPGQNRSWRSISAAWAPGAATSTTIWPPAMGSARLRTGFKTCTCPAARTRRSPLCRTNWCAAFHWWVRADSSRNA